MSDGEPTRSATRPLMAIDVQADHRVLREVPGRYLRDVPLLAEGTTLTRRSEYIDVHDPARADFPAEGTEVVKPGQRVIARTDVGAEAWRELREACDRVARRRPLRRAS